MDEQAELREEGEAENSLGKGFIKDSADTKFQEIPTNI